jgi:hypothetical protein
MKVTLSIMVVAEGQRAGISARVVEVPDGLLPARIAEELMMLAEMCVTSHTPEPHRAD